MVTAVAQSDRGTRVTLPPSPTLRRKLRRAPSRFRCRRSDVLYRTRTLVGGIYRLVKRPPITEQSWSSARGHRCCNGVGRTALPLYPVRAQRGVKFSKFNSSGDTTGIIGDFYACRDLYVDAEIDGLKLTGNAAEKIPIAVSIDWLRGLRLVTQAGLPGRTFLGSPRRQLCLLFRRRTLRCSMEQDGHQRNAPIFQFSDFETGAGCRI